MHATLPLLAQTQFPPLRRHRTETLQVNVGYVCNQTCVHCHVNAGPTRTETMTRATALQVLEYLAACGATTLDITGGAPELNAQFRMLVGEARRRGVHVIDRCNLTILHQPGQEDLAAFLAAQGVAIIASLPCYTEELVDRQRGKGVYESSIQAIRELNALGYGQPDGALTLDLVYNPQGPSLPPPQAALTLANMPIQRFGSTLVTRGQFDSYMDLLRESHRDANLDTVMCRSLVSVDWQGYLYDCDFNQMLGLPLRVAGKPRVHVKDAMGRDLDGNPIVVRDHCYGCTAGQGSSCGGALA